LLLANRVAGFSGKVGFGILFFGRISREQRMMLDTFGDSCRAYINRTGRITGIATGFSTPIAKTRIGKSGS